MEELVILPVQPVLLPTKIIINVLHVTVLVRLALIIQVHVQVVNQEKDTCKFQEPINHVLKNVLKEHSHKEEYAKFVTLDVLSVLVPLLTVSLAQLEHIFITVLVGITVQVSLITEHALINVHQDIGDSQIKNANNVHQNAALVIQTQLV